MSELLSQPCCTTCKHKEVALNTIKGEVELSCGYKPYAVNMAGVLIDRTQTLRDVLTSANLLLELSLMEKGGTLCYEPRDTQQQLRKQYRVSDSTPSTGLPIHFPWGLPNLERT